MSTHARAVTRSVTVPHEGHGVSLARHAFAKELASAGISDDVRQDAVLVMSELVSNAIRHGAPLPDPGSTLDRDATRPYEVTEVRRQSDGQLNVFVREIIKQ